MNICEFFKKNNLPHKIKGNKVIQVCPMYRSLIRAEITCLKNFIQTEYIDLSFNEITTLKGFIQTAPLILKGNKIKDLLGFTQNSYLVLDDNSISSFEGFTQNKGKLSIRNNNLTNLDHLNQNDTIDVSYNDIKYLNNFSQGLYSSFFAYDCPLYDLKYWSGANKNIKIAVEEDRYPECNYLYIMYLCNHNGLGMRRVIRNLVDFNNNSLFPKQAN